MFILLSFPLTEDAPAPGGRTALRIETDESLALGAVGNTYRYTVWNHAGTHVDGPAHMLEGKASIAEMPIDRFDFRRPLLVDIPPGDSRLVTSADLRGLEDELLECDLLLLRTGSCRHRHSDPLRYRDRNPGLSVEVAEFLTGGSAPRLRAAGIDSISMACTEHLDEGLKAHHVLLGAAEPVVLVEDMNLTDAPLRLARVLVVPLFVRGIDSCQCTVLAEPATT